VKWGALLLGLGLALAKPLNIEAIFQDKAMAIIKGISKQYKAALEPGSDIHTKTRPIDRHSVI